MFGHVYHVVMRVPENPTCLNMWRPSMSSPVGTIVIIVVCFVKLCNHWEVIKGSTNKIWMPNKLQIWPDQKFYSFRIKILLYFQFRIEFYFHFFTVFFSNSHWILFPLSHCFSSNFAPFHFQFRTTFRTVLVLPTAEP